MGKRAKENPNQQIRFRRFLMSRLLGEFAIEGQGLYDAMDFITI